MSVKEDKPLGSQESGGVLARFGVYALGSDGYVGRVVQDATTAAGDSVPSVWQTGYTVRQVGEPALGVMGGLIQLVSSPAERVPGIGPDGAAEASLPFTVRFVLESPRVVSGNAPSITARSETAAPYSLPPVSSFSAPLLGADSGSTGSSESPAKTTPAPNSIPERFDRTAPHGPDVTSGDVSPLNAAAPAATDVAPTGRQAIGIDRTHRPGVSPD